MLNDSSTGGYLLPIDRGGELNDDALRDFLQKIVVGITGMSGTLVYPRWQEEPPIFPSAETDWCAVGVQRRRRTAHGYIVHERNGNQEDDVLYRTMLLDILCSFYGPNCESNAELLSSGLLVLQNQEVLDAAGFEFIDSENTVTTADKLNNKWVTRVDQQFCLSRSQEYRYPVLSLISANVIAQVENSALSIGITSQSGVPQLPLFGWGLQNGLIAGWGTGNWK